MIGKRPHGSSWPDVVIERDGYITRRVILDGREVPSIVRIEVIDDAGDAPRVVLTLYALARIVDLRDEDERPSVVAGQLAAFDEEDPDDG